MKKCCLFISVMLMCFLCACSVTEQKERTTMYDIIESGNTEEIAAAAEAAGAVPAEATLRPIRDRLPAARRR